MGQGSRGRPRGTTGKAAALSPTQIKQVFRAARRVRHGDRAEVALALSIELGLRASELAALKWCDVYNSDRTVREAISVEPAYSRGPKTRVVASSPKLRGLLADYREKQTLCAGECDQDAPLFRSQRGGQMTSASMARFITGLYRKAAIAGGSSRTGRRTHLRAVGLSASPLGDDP
jgi:integrase/recombinase XerD